MRGHSERPALERTSDADVKSRIRVMRYQEEFQILVWSDEVIVKCSGMRDEPQFTVRHAR